MRILVTGGTGLVGSNVLKAARERPGVQVVATVFDRRPAVPWEFSTVPMDLEYPASARRAVEAIRPDAVIHCAAPRDEDRLEVDHEWGWRVMVAGTRTIAEACRAVGARLIFVSSDWVFGRGGQPPYDENSPPCPANYFGFLKTIGETIVRSLCPEGAVVRIAGVYGPNWSDPTHEQTEAGIGFGWLPNYFVYRLSRGRTVSVWTDYVNILANPSLASDVAGALLDIALEGHRGLFHGAGRDSISRLDLARAVAQVFGYDPELVQTATPEQMEPGQLQGKLTAPHDCRLSVAASEDRLGRVNLGVHAGLKEYRRQLEAMGKGVI